MTLSGGMKRRAMIAKALSHEPEILFLDEPSAGVDVELRRDMWEMVRGLRDDGVTVILTTHYIEEAEEMADRIGVINRGELILVEDKAALMKKLGRKQLTLQLQDKLDRVPEALRGLPLELAGGGAGLVYTFEMSRTFRTLVQSIVAPVILELVIGYVGAAATESIMIGAILLDQHAAPGLADGDAV